MVMLVLLIYFIFFFPLLIRLFGPQCIRWWFMGARAQAVYVNPGITLKCLHFSAVRTDFTSSHRIHHTEKDEGRLFLTAGAVIAWFWVCSTFFFLLFIAHAVARTTIWRNIFFLAQRKMVFGWRENCAKRQNDEFSPITACSVMFGAHFRRHCCVYLCASVYVCRHP